MEGDREGTPERMVAPGDFVQPSFSCQKLGFASMGSLPSHLGMQLEFSGPVRGGSEALELQKIEGCRVLLGCCCLPT